MRIKDIRFMVFRALNIVQTTHIDTKHGKNKLRLNKLLNIIHKELEEHESISEDR